MVLGYLRAMLKLLFWALLAVGIWLYIKGQQAINARQAAELEAMKRNSNTPVEDVDAEVIDITPKTRANQ